MMNFTSHSAADTEAIGARFARMLRPGDIVAFRGGMGAGKTAFTRGMASVLAPDAEVASPHLRPGQRLRRQGALLAL